MLPLAYPCVYPLAAGIRGYGWTLEDAFHAQIGCPSVAGTKGIQEVGGSNLSPRPSTPAGWHDRSGSMGAYEARDYSLLPEPED